MVRTIKAFILLAVLATLFCGGVYAQNEIRAGANLDFTYETPPTFEGWVARTGTYATNTSFSEPQFTFTKIYAKPAEADITIWGASSSDKYFVLQTNTTAKDEKSEGGLYKIPSNWGFKRSVRLGNTKAGGDCSELTYELEVTPANCLLTFCYAMVLETPHVGDHYANPTFQVEITDMNNQLVNECCFFENCGDIDPKNKMPDGWHLGLLDTGMRQWIYSDWNRISVNLIPYEGSVIKITVRLSGCAYSAHGGYGYFAAKVEPPATATAGCTGEGDTVTTTEAPVGFAKYEWFEANYETIDQGTLEGWYSPDKVLSNDRVFAITNDLMEGAKTKYFAVRLTAPTQHVRWESALNSAPACITYIPSVINDMRPIFDLQKAHRYIPVDVENEKNEVGFLFGDVEQISEDFPLVWQQLDFGDGTALELKYENNKWVVDDNTPLDENRVRLTYNDKTDEIDTIFHEYLNTGSYLYTRSAQSESKPSEETPEIKQCLKSDTLNVDVFVRPSIALTSPDTVCDGDKVTIAVSSPGDDASGYTYQWWYGEDDVNETEPFFTGKTYEIDNIKEDIIVHVKVTTNEGFYNWAWDTVIVQAYPDLTIEGDTMICLGQNLHLTATDANPNSIGMMWSYQRPTYVKQVSDGANPALFEESVRQDTTVYLWAETSNHCFSWDSVNIVVVIPTVTSNKKEICTGDEVILTGGGAADFSWSSDPEDNSLPEDNKGMNPIRVSPDTTTNYTLTGYGQNGCEAKTNIRITVVPHPVIKIRFTPEYVDVDEPYVMFTDSSDYANTSKWTFSDGGQTEGRSATYSFHDLSIDSVTVHLVSTNVLGCSSEGDTVLPVVLFAVWMPNAFNPDDDGVDDYFFFVTQNDLNNVRFEIFNRWGAKMYLYENDKYVYSGKNDVEKYGWDGKFKGQYVPNGTYVWRLTYQRPGNTRVYDRQGTVTLVR